MENEIIQSITLNDVDADDLAEGFRQELGELIEGRLDARHLVSYWSEKLFIIENAGKEAYGEDWYELNTIRGPQPSRSRGN